MPDDNYKYEECWVLLVLVICICVLLLDQMVYKVKEEFAYYISLHTSHRSQAAKEEKQEASSMKHLIAVAQARRRETHSHVPPVLASAASPVPVSTSFDNISLSESNGKHHISPPSNEVHSTILTDSGSDGFHNPRAEAPSPIVNSAQRLSAQGGSLSCGTEAAVARDALEGMLETLSRTKDSIGRATRLAIECAKYGIATEVWLLPLYLSIYALFI